MSGPTGVSNGYLRDRSLVNVQGGSSNFLAKTGDFANFFEIHNLSWFFAINAQTSRVVTSVLLTGETGTKNFKDFMASLYIKGDRSSVRRPA